MRKMLIASALLLLPACAVNRPIVTIPRAACADLVPGTWAQGVEATPVPDNAPGLSDMIGKPLTAAMAAMIIGPWATAYVAMNGQLEKANGRTADSMTIQRNCEKLVNAARPDGK